MKEEEKENNSKTARIITASIISFTILVIGLLISNTASATINSDSVCLIIVSGCEGYSDNELEKASSFFNCLNQTLDRDDIYYLTATSESGSQGPANISNVENSFQWLQNNWEPSDEVIIYISDHAKRSFNDTYFSFNDGNISADTIDSWIDEIESSTTTIIVNGERSGLCGPVLQDPDRDILCSMRSYQTYSPDRFNITRSLNDPTADTDNDGTVSFIEAFRKEELLLTDTGQDPVLF